MIKSEEEKGEIGTGEEKENKKEKVGKKRGVENGRKGKNGTGEEKKEQKRGESRGRPEWQKKDGRTMYIFLFFINYLRY